MLLCIQGNAKRIIAVDEFQKMLEESDGYKYLLKEYNVKAIFYCLWDNFNSCYYEQQHAEFLNCLENLEKSNQ
jgi:hypothetical protein